MPRIDFEQFLTPTEGGRPEAEQPSSAARGAMLRSVEKAVKSLPPLPAVIHELLDKLSSTEVSMGWLEQKISTDPSLATRLLKMANSSFYNVRNEVKSVDRAMMVLGLNTVSNLLMATTMRAVIRGACRIPGYGNHGVLRHSLAAGICADRLGKELECLRPHKEELFLAGLLHDIGMVALEGHYDRRAEDFLSAGYPLVTQEAERAVLGVDHLMVGEMVLKQWRLPEHLLGPVTRHHEPPDQLTDDPLCLATALCDLYLHRLGFGLTSPQRDEAQLKRCTELLDTELASIDTILEGFDQEVAMFLGGVA